MKANAEHIARLKTLVGSVIDDEELFLFEISVKPYSHQLRIEIFVDSKDGVTVDRLSSLSRKLTDAIDTGAIINEDYRIDVSSPGIDRPLVYDWQYRRNIGRVLEIDFADGIEPRHFRGKLESVNGDGIVITTKKESINLTFEQIIKAIVQLDLN